MIQIEKYDLKTKHCIMNMLNPNAFKLLFYETIVEVQITTNTMQHDCCSYHDNVSNVSSYCDPSGDAASPFRYVSG